MSTNPDDNFGLDPDNLLDPGMKPLDDMVDANPFPDVAPDAGLKPLTDKELGLGTGFPSTDDDLGDIPW